MTGHVSKALQAELRRRCRKHGLVVWLDTVGAFTEAVDAWIAQPPSAKGLPPLVAWRGSFLELLLALETHENGLDPKPLIIHVPRFNKDTIKETPVYPYYCAGHVFELGLATLIRDASAGYAAPKALESFLTGSPDLAAADRWLADQIAGSETGPRAAFARLGLRDLVTRLLGGLSPLHDPKERVAKLGEIEREAMIEDLEVRLGMDKDFREFCSLEPTDSLDDLGIAIAGWALCVEYVHDLKGHRKPTLAVLERLLKLPKALVDECRALASELRNHHESAYVRASDEFTERLGSELEQGNPEDLGHIDTFEREELRVFKASLASLATAEWDKVRDWAKERLGANSFWIRRDERRRREWQLVQAAAELGTALATHMAFLKGCESAEDGLRAYVEAGWTVDRAQRRLEQLRKIHLVSMLPHFSELRSALNGLRVRYREWLDKSCEGFVKLCEDSGFLCDEARRQRHIFERRVQPLVESAEKDKDRCVAYLLVDGLRYEMAADLAEHFKPEGRARSPVTLNAVLSELPSITSVGMNALAPVADDGRLVAGSETDLNGFRRGSFVVRDPATRQKAIGDRIGGQTCPWWSLAEVLERDSTSLKRGLSKSRLVVVHSLEIDKAGEVGNGLLTFEDTLMKLRSAINLLRSAGINRFVITSDHGFLLHEPGPHRKIAWGTCRDPDRRYALSPAPVSSDELCSVAPAALGIQGFRDHFVFPRSSAVFDRGKRDDSYVHGGPSLQERVVPVLQLVWPSMAGGDLIQYRIKLDAGRGIADMNALEVSLEVSGGGDMFAEARDIELAVRVPERDDVHVEVCDVHEGRLAGASFYVRAGHPATVYFRVMGPADSRVPVEVYHPTHSDEVKAAMSPQRYDMLGAPRARDHAAEDSASAKSAPAAETPAHEESERWLDELPNEGVRKVFRHIATHKRITEAEGSAMLGSPRAWRRFALKFEEYAARAPFSVHIEPSGGGKTYVRI